ncbi:MULTISPECIES: PHP domain-containing protein [unclassified Prochlorococcus]|uniref:PHP domain-containing protein n=1 Tax=unclassified Prochlorococcus TaxID=2627481 RepID=UPI000533B48F|nr:MULTISPECIES: PHP domain-containing protein [unclassified Prochlorococcus]KGG15279.1 PHP family metal-dependent phosphoesterase [Prochlorococcus sp. MIT 0602]KGG17556.1 PHP family metal-dependent phosphoesterase [Prochlorococcus sp. MIT 0603]
MIKENILIKDVLSKVDIDSCPEKINLHTHTLCSDGSLNPIDLLKQANQLGLEHLAITDHHTLHAHHIINTWLHDAHIESISTRLWTGIEISALLNGCLVHIIGLDIDINSKFIEPYTKGEAVTGSDLLAVNVIKAIKKSNGISILAHPARYRKDYKLMIEQANLLNIDAIEVWYDYDFLPIWMPSVHICKLINKIVDSTRLLKSCGTDSHGYSLLGR